MQMKIKKKIFNMLYFNLWQEIMPSKPKQGQKQPNSDTALKLTTDTQSTETKDGHLAIVDQSRDDLRTGKFQYIMNPGELSFSIPILVILLNCKFFCINNIHESHIKLHSLIHHNKTEYILTKSQYFLRLSLTLICVMFAIAQLWKKQYGFMNLSLHDKSPNIHDIV